MRCISCECFSFQILCKDCQKTLLKPTITKRTLPSNLEVYSFYKYEEIKELINTKYEVYGHKVFKTLANLSFNEFAKNYISNETITIIPIDDRIKKYFSQTAILAKALQTKSLKPRYNLLHSQNDIQYAGKDLVYRKKHKRDFIYTGKNNINVILVDDIITTGMTLTQAYDILAEHNCKVLFALTLCDAQG